MTTLFTKLKRWCGIATPNEDFLELLNEMAELTGDVLRQERLATLKARAASEDVPGVPDP